MLFRFLRDKDHFLGSEEIRGAEMQIRCCPCACTVQSFEQKAFSNRASSRLFSVFGVLEFKRLNKRDLCGYPAGGAKVLSGGFFLRNSVGKVPSASIHTQNALYVMSWSNRCSSRLQVSTSLFSARRGREGIEKR